MSPLVFTLLVGSPSLAAGSGTSTDAAAGGSTFHPPVPLRDRAGVLVRDSHQPVHFGSTCGGCHDVGYIEDHAYHLRPGSSPEGAPLERSRFDVGRGLAERFAPLVYGDPRGGLGRDPAEAHRALGALAVGDAPGSEMNCLSCHGSAAARAARRAALSQGKDAIPTRQLVALGLAEPSDGGWMYLRLDPEGAVPGAALGIQASTSEACGDCHAPTPTRAPFTLPTARAPGRAAATGFVFSGQLLSDSGLNLRNKEALARPFDVHAERLLDCASCHFSVNDPAYRSPGDDGPAHLRFDARREAPSAFLERPSHHLANGRPPQRVIGEEVAGSMRTCTGCHDAEAAHPDFPSSARHLSVLACESCHLPSPRVPLLTAVDWSLPGKDGAPRRHYRGVDGPPFQASSLIDGARLVWARSTGAEGKIAPHNLVAHAFWVGGEPTRPLAAAVVSNALRTSSGAVRSELRALGVTGRLHSPEAVAKAGELIEAAGVFAPRLVGEVHPFSLHHGIAPAEAAKADCDGCHSGGDDHPLAPVTIATDLPPGIEVDLAPGIEGGTLQRSDRANGLALSWHPSSEQLGLHLFGRARTGWLDQLGLWITLLTLAAAAAHGLLRLRAAKRNHE